MRKHILVQPAIADWRVHARQLLQRGFAPEEVDLQDATVSATLPLDLDLAQDEPLGHAFPSPHTSQSFLDLAEIVSVHRSADRWNLLYRALYRLQTNRDLLKIEIDSDVAKMRQMEQQVRRDLHKMHAFVRFRKLHTDVIDEANPFVPTAAGGLVTGFAPAPAKEHFVAWYQPDHRILPLAVPFFAERFAPMNWTILTPDESATWDPVTRQILFGPGFPREAAPAEDELETLWRSYYGSIYNPARLNQGAMRQEMPVRYWKNLPEVSLLPTLITESAARVRTMVKVQESKPSAAPFVPAEHTLPLIQTSLPSCKGCDLYQHATQVVPGVGPSPLTTQRPATLMLVGEQPGDQEDRQGLPFVGPAGRILDKVFDELGIARDSIYLTNAVKHFKFVQRGKLRLHQNPRMSEITACRPWLLAEIDAVRPQVILCLGASASKSLLGGTFALMRDHGKVLASPYSNQVIATIHPSAVLRARDQAAEEELYRFLREDMALAWKIAAEPIAAREPAITTL